MFESLESRRLMSATFDPASAAVTVAGTDDADTIVVRRTGGRLVVVDNGARSEFALATVRQVNIACGAGDDRVRAAGVSVRCAISGDDGDDRIVCGSGDDGIYGGAGDDVIQGGGGNDDLSDDSGDDRLSGGAGDDTFRDYLGFNRLSGGPGGDSAQGFAGRQQSRGVEVEEFTDVPTPAPIQRFNEPEILTADRNGRAVVEVQVTVGSVGYIVRYGEVARNGNDFSVEGVIEQLPGAYGGAIVTREDRFELGPLDPGAYTFTLRTLDGVAVATHAFQINAPVVREPLRT